MPRSLNGADQPTYAVDVLEWDPAVLGTWRPDVVATHLLRSPDENGQGWADIIDLLTMYPEVRWRLVRVLGEHEAGG